ncbi:MAG TPA: aminotransferase class V-fold PLP-dependent enzyme [Streptosporangiaceae bacterium]|nr:aminotransferase class V-fold PLP-dependent enzyme [Streptosporangiaceae bacterium]
MSKAYAGSGRQDAWQVWRDRRPPRHTLHLDTAAAGRSSLGTLQTVAAHAGREAEAGSYVAEAEAQPVLDACRAGLATLLGVPPGGVAFTESGSAALTCLLTVWPLQPGDTVAVVPSEWGPNLASFGHHGLLPVELATHADGTVDLQALETVLATRPPAFVHLTQVASHRSLVQPVAEAAALCRAAGVPLWVDAAQALGHVDVACGADVLYAVSRKWLTGPRGVGMLAVTSRWWDILQPRTSPLDVSGLPEGASPVRLLEPLEAHVAGRIGLGHAVREFLDAGPEHVWRRLAEVGTMTREMLAGLPGWDVLPASGPSSAITALRATAGQDIVKARSRLLAEHRIVTTAEIPARAPREMTGPLLRVSPHVDCTGEDLSRLRDALLEVS